jgi:hypothetical protein
VAPPLVQFSGKRSNQLTTVPSYAASPRRRAELRIVQPQEIRDRFSLISAVKMCRSDEIGSAPSLGPAAEADQIAQTMRRATVPRIVVASIEKITPPQANRAGLAQVDHPLREYFRSSAWSHWRASGADNAQALGQSMEG